MPQVDLEHGHFSWVDLITPDPQAARAFYGALFGWNGREQPTGPYTMFLKGENPVAGMAQMSPEMRSQGMPPIWTSYILVDDVDVTAGRVPELGGTILMPPMDVTDQGRMCMIQDPTGATVALWQGGEHCGAELFNEEGALSWNELATRDQDVAVRFYGELLGWGWEDMPLPQDATYKICTVGGRMNGGVMAMTDEWPPEIPAHWAVYFQVADVDSAHARVLELGGRSHVEPMDITVGRMAVVADPQGGTFTLFQASDTTPE